MPAKGARRINQLGKMGRPVLLTKELQDTVCGFILKGHFFDTAINLSGVIKSTGTKWLELGAKYKNNHDAYVNGETNDVPDIKHKKYYEFFVAVRTAIAEAEDKDLTKINSSNDWKATAWKMERRNRKHWGAKLEVNLNVDLTRLSDEQLERIANGEDINAVIGFDDQSLIGSDIE